MEKPTTNPFKSALGRRIFLSTAILLIATVGVAVFITRLIGQRIADEAVTQALERANLVQESFDEQRLAQLDLIVEIFAKDPVFRSYLIEASESGDTISILDQLDERRGELQFDFAMVLDPDGQVIARTDATLQGGEDLSNEPLVAEALENFGAGGVWNKDGVLYDSVITALGAGDVLQGFFLVGYGIDDELALRLRRISDTEVSVVTQGEAGVQLAATTLDDLLSNELLKLLERDPSLLAANEEMRQEIDLGGRRWLALTRPLLGAIGEPVGAVLSLASLEAPLEPYERIYKVLALVGALALLAALVLTYFIARGVVGPLAQLANAASKAADGDYDQQIEGSGQDEAGRLAGAFGVLLSELREKRDMEAYINELSRNLPDPEPAGSGRGTGIVQPPREEISTLLGIELRGYSGADPGGFADPAGSAVDRLSRDLRSIANAIGGHGGRIEVLAGHRMIATFQGPRRAAQGLAASSEVLSYLGRQTAPQTYEGVVVLLDGPLISGSVAWAEAPDRGLTGEAVDELENLLRVAQPGYLLMGDSVRSVLASQLEEAGIVLQPQRSSVSQQTLYNLSAQSIGVFAAPETSATMVMTQSGPSQQVTLASLGPGSLLGQRFEILSVLGSGGMGIVYKARDLTLDELVALKMLKGFAVEGDSQLERLKDELRLARKIGHPNVLRTYDFGEMDGVPFISMEYVLGITLRQLLDQSGRLPMSAGLRLARQLCKGLSAAHAESVLHRDIKPENLILEHTGNVKLMDFGIARPITRRQPGQTNPEGLVGTPFYLAPEQLAGEEPDERADLYACGVVLYEIFTGKLPFKISGNVMQVIRQRLDNEPPIPPSEVWPNIPKALEALILRCLEFDREARYPNSLAVLRELENLRA